MAARLSALDRSFLTAETATAHMHVGWAAVCDPPLNGPRPSFEELREHIAGRLGRAPRYRQKLAPVPFDLHGPSWVDDDRFDIDHHVLRAPASNIDELVAIAMSTQLERSRPMWECWIADRLDDGRVGVVGKVHHCMVDGLAAVELAAVLADPTPDPPPLEVEPWTPAPAPRALQRLFEGAIDRARENLRENLTLAGLPGRLAASPGRLLVGVDELGRAASALAHSLYPSAPQTDVFNDSISPLRHLARLARPLEELIRIKSRFGTTVNDVVLAVCAGGVRRFLGRRGEEPIRLKAMVPVSVRDDEDELGNRISFMFVELPCDDPDPVDRLLQIRVRTSERKRAGEPGGAETVLRMVGHTPPALQRIFTRLVASPRMFNLVVSNIPGPQEPLWMRGCELRECYPVVPLVDHHALSIGVTTIRDGAFFGFYADRKTLPDARVLAQCVGESIDELLALCPSPDGGSRRIDENGHAGAPAAPASKVPAAAGTR